MHSVGAHTTNKNRRRLLLVRWCWCWCLFYARRARACVRCFHNYTVYQVCVFADSKPTFACRQPIGESVRKCTQNNIYIFVCVGLCILVPIVYTINWARFLPLQHQSRIQLESMQILVVPFIYAKYQGRHDSCSANVHNCVCFFVCNIFCIAANHGDVDGSQLDRADRVFGVRLHINSTSAVPGKRVFHGYY